LRRKIQRSKTATASSPVKPVRDRNFVDVGEKLFRVLEAIAHNSKEPPSLEQIMRIVGMAKTTVYRLLYTLKELGYVDQVAPGSGYVLSHKFFELGRPAMPSQHLKHIAQPLLQQLQIRTGESINLAILDEGCVAFLTVIESLNPFRFASTGAWDYVHCTAVGKCLIAYHTDEEIDAIIRARGLPKRARNTITTGTQLLLELAKVRAHGYAQSVEENNEGVIGIAAPIWGREKTPVAAISVSGPAIRMQLILDSVKDEVLRTARRLSAMLGHDVVQENQGRRPVEESVNTSSM
jgi:DNA-binding IclR family transcriptional regulator